MVQEKRSLIVEYVLHLFRREADVWASGIAVIVFLLGTQIDILFQDPLPGHVRGLLGLGAASVAYFMVWAIRFRRLTPRLSTSNSRQYWVASSALFAAFIVAMVVAALWSVAFEPVCYRYSLMAGLVAGVILWRVLRLVLK